MYKKENVQYSGSAQNCKKNMRMRMLVNLFQR